MKDQIHMKTWTPELGTLETTLDSLLDNTVSKLPNSFSCERHEVSLSWKCCVYINFIDNIQEILGPFHRWNSSSETCEAKETPGQHQKMQEMVQM